MPVIIDTVLSNKKGNYDITRTKLVSSLDVFIQYVCNVLSNFRVVYKYLYIRYYTQIVILQFFLI